MCFLNYVCLSNKLIFKKFFLKIKMDKLYEFVAQECFYRDWIDNYLHVKRLAEISLNIYDNEYNDTCLRKRLEIVAMLYDITNPKYDNNGDSDIKLIKFLETHFPDDLDLYNIIKNISSDVSRNVFSKKENEIIYRIISDADKIKDMGKIGLLKCILKAEKLYPEYNREQIKNYVMTHDRKKILNMESLLYTKTGKKIAQRQIEQFRIALSKI